MKKYLSMLLAVLMLMSVMTISAGAVEVSEEECAKYIGLSAVDKNGNDAQVNTKQQNVAIGCYIPYMGGMNADKYDVPLVSVNPDAQLLFKNLGGAHKGFISINGYKAIETTASKELARGIIDPEYCSLEGGITKNDTIYMYDSIGYYMDKKGDWVSYDEGGETSDFYYLTNGNSLKVGFPGGNDGALYIIHAYISFDENYPYEAVYQMTFYIKLDSSVPLTNTETSKTPETPVVTNNFSDVKESDYFYKPIYWAVENGITKGTTATTFSPKATCTNAHILTFLWRAYGSQEPTITNPFTDVKESDYFYKAALWAAQKGLISGKEFKANDPCTRGSTVKFMWTLAGKPTGNTASFSDVPSNSDLYNAVAWAYKVGVTAGTTENTFSPNNTCTRGQIVTFLYRGLANK